MADDDDADDEKKLQYVKQEFLQPISGHSATTLDYDGGATSSLDSQPIEFKHKRSQTPKLVWCLLGKET